MATPSKCLSSRKNSPMTKQPQRASEITPSLNPTADGSPSSGIVAKRMASRVRTVSTGNLLCKIHQLTTPRETADRGQRRPLLLVMDSTRQMCPEHRKADFRNRKNGSNSHAACTNRSACRCITFQYRGNPGAALDVTRTRCPLGRGTLGSTTRLCQTQLNLHRDQDQSEHLQYLAVVECQGSSRAGHRLQPAE